MSPLPDDVLEFLRQNAPPPPVAEGELTSVLAAKAWGESETTARKKLEDAVVAGKLRKEDRKSANGKPTLVYFPVNAARAKPRR